MAMTAEELTTFLYEQCLFVRGIELVERDGEEALHVTTEDGRHLLIRVGDHTP